MQTAVIVAPVSGWMIWKDGQPYGLPNGWSETKESLLIGYDMIPLRGLETTEQVMAAKGKVARETLVELATGEDHHAYAAVVDGRFIPHMLEWSVCYDTAEKAFEHTCFYFGKPRKGHQSNRPIHIMSDEDAYTCDEYFWRSVNWHIYHDRRRLSTLERARQKAKDVFTRCHIEIVPIRYQLYDTAWTSSQN